MTAEFDIPGFGGHLVTWGRCSNEIDARRYACMAVCSKVFLNLHPKKLNKATARQQIKDVAFGWGASVLHQLRYTPPSNIS